MDDPDSPKLLEEAEQIYYKQTSNIQKGMSRDEFKKALLQYDPLIPPERLDWAFKLINSYGTDSEGNTRITVDELWEVLRNIQPAKCYFNYATDPRNGLKYPEFMALVKTAGTSIKDDVILKLFKTYDTGLGRIPFEAFSNYWYGKRGTLENGLRNNQ